MEEETGSIFSTIAKSIESHVIVYRAGIARKTGSVVQIPNIGSTEKESLNNRLSSVMEDDRYICEVIYRFPIP